MNPCAEAETKAFIQNAAECADRKDCTEFFFAAALKETDSVIGVAILMNNDVASEIGWILHRDYWRQGYGTEMGRTLLDFGFGSLHLRRIVAHCDTENTGSYRVMEKIGMRREGRFIKGRIGNSVLNQDLRDEFSYAILREEWEKRRQECFP
jgi:RimJ/RimL family protein N-acetyltransferase